VAAVFFALWIYMSKKITITYTDVDSLTDSEIKKSAKQLYGDNANITIAPMDNSPKSYIYHGILGLVTDEQVRLFFDEGEYIYREALPKLRAEILLEIGEILNQVIIDNEERIA